MSGREIRDFFYEPQIRKIHWGRVIPVTVVLVDLVIVLLFLYGRTTTKGLRNTAPGYTIGFVIDTSRNRNGTRETRYYYMVSGKSYHAIDSNTYDIKLFNNMEGRYFVKYYSKDPANHVILWQCPVPASIPDFPPDGWKRKPVACKE